MKTRSFARMTAAGLVASLAGLAQADMITYTTTFSGAAESPPNASPGTGTATVIVDTTAMTMRVQASFSGLLGSVTAAHIHGGTATPFTGTAGIMTIGPSFTAFPLGVTAGTYDFTYNMALTSSYNAGFVTANGGTAAGAFARFLQNMDQGRAYFNIHTSVVGGGEIRGFMVPGPGMAGVLALGGLVAARRRRA